MLTRMRSAPPRRRCTRRGWGSQEQEFLCVGAHPRQVVLAEIALDEREQVALGVLVAELLDDLVDEFSPDPR